MVLRHLFNPIQLGTVEIRNRCVLAPMGVGIYSHDETYSKREIRYFEERAMGGVGLVITPFTRVHGSLASIPLTGIYDDRFIPSHRELVETVHKHGAKIFLQIALLGGKWSPDAPSAIYSPNYLVKPRALATGELDCLVDSFIDAWAKHTIVTQDQDGKPLAKPIVYQSYENNSRTDETIHNNKKWIVGSDPDDSGLIETCATSEWNDVGGVAFLPGDYKYFFKCS